MYDSRDDRPVIGGGSHRAGHADRLNSDMGEGQYVDYSTPRSTVLALRKTTKAVIAEGIEEYLDQDLGVETWVQECHEDENATNVTSVDRTVGHPYTSESTKFSAKATKEATMYSNDHTIPRDPRDVGVIHKPRTVKHPWRTKGEAFDPSKVSDTLQVALVADVTTTQPASNRQPAN